MNKVVNDDIFSDEIYKLKETAEKIQKTMQKIDESASHAGI